MISKNRFSPSDLPRIPVGQWQGTNVYIVPDQPRMTLSAECVPGKVPWPPGFKEEIDAWMLEFFGTTNLLNDRQILKAGDVIPGLGAGLYVNPRTFAALTKAVR